MSWVRRRLSVSMYSPYSRTFSGFVDAAEAQNSPKTRIEDERRAQLVRDVGDEVALHLREPHLPRDRAARQTDRAEEHDERAAGPHHVVAELIRRQLLGARARVAHADAPVVKTKPSGCVM